MKEKLRSIFPVIFMTFFVFHWIRCSTTTVDPLPALPEVPEYTAVTHPEGYDISDVEAMFYSETAPKERDFSQCLVEVEKLRASTPSTEEVRLGVKELVHEDPVKYHWCFYGKILEAENVVRSQALLKEKGEKISNIYLSLVPLARAFQEEYRDPRYLRWATVHYQKISAWVFYRPLKLTSQGQSDLLKGFAATPYGFEKKPQAARPILEKYGLRQPSPVTQEANRVAPLEVPEPPAGDAGRAPAAAEKAPIPTPAVQGLEEIPADGLESSPVLENE